MNFTQARTCAMCTGAFHVELTPAMQTFGGASRDSGYESIQITGAGQYAALAADFDYPLFPRNELENVELVSLSLIFRLEEGASGVLIARSILNQHAPVYSLHASNTTLVFVFNGEGDTAEIQMGNTALYRVEFDLPALADDNAWHHVSVLFDFPFTLNVSFNCQQ